MSTGNKPSKSDKKTDADYEVYLEERKSLVTALLDQARSFDKYVLTLAGGTFGLSFLFIKQIVPQPIHNTLPVLIAAWSCFGTSILITLLSFLFSQAACLKQIEIMEKSWFSKDTNEGKKSPNMYNKITLGLNWISMVLFVAGVVLLIIFATRNLLTL